MSVRMRRVRIPVMTATVTRLSDSPCLRVIVTGCCSGQWLPRFGKWDTRLTDASPPPHASFVGTPASTEVGRVVKAILAVVAATNEALMKRSFANCILV